MEKVEVKLRETVSKVLHPANGDVDRDKLEKFLMSMIDKLEARVNYAPPGTVGVFEENVQTLIEVCAKLWEEKEKWHTKFHDMADRYNKHLDQDIETYNKMLGHRR